jgi:hypothetical protein
VLHLPPGGKRMLAPNARSRVTGFTVGATRRAGSHSATQARLPSWSCAKSTSPFFLRDAMRESQNSGNAFRRRGEPGQK